jgi:hypothetical protein
MADELPLIQITNKDLNRSHNFFNRKKTSQEKNKERNKRSTAKKSAAKGGPLDFLITTNEWLEDMPIRIVMAFDNFVGSGENAIQSKVDVICAWLAWKVNVAVERKRQAILRILHEQYQKTVGGKVMRMAQAIQSFVNDPIGALGSFASAIFGPVMAVFQWIVELGVQILKLAENLAKIVSVLPPSPPNPHINYDKFKLKVKSISMDEVMSDPSSLPAPEVMFPEPTKPFSKESFSESFETASAALKSSQKKYILSEEDKNALAGFDKRSLSSIIQEETEFNIGAGNSTL